MLGRRSMSGRLARCLDGLDSRGFVAILFLSTLGGFRDHFGRVSVGFVRVLGEFGVLGARLAFRFISAPIRCQDSARNFLRVFRVHFAATTALLHCTPSLEEGGLSKLRFRCSTPNNTLSRNLVMGPQRGCEGANPKSSRAYKLKPLSLESKLCFVNNMHRLDPTMINKLKLCVV